MKRPVTVSPLPPLGNPDPWAYVTGCWSIARVRSFFDLPRTCRVVFLGRDAHHIEWWAVEVEPGAGDGIAPIAPDGQPFTGTDEVPWCRGGRS